MTKEAYVRTLEPYFTKRSEEPFWSYSHPQNLLQNGDFEAWSAGSAVGDEPDGWTESGVGTVQREVGTVKRCNYSAELTHPGGAGGSTLYQTAGCSLFYRGLCVSLSAWVYADDADRVRLSITDGVGASYSEYHPGDGAWWLLTVARLIDVGANQVTASFRIEAGAGAVTAWIDAAHLCLGPVPRGFAYKPLHDDGSVSIGAGVITKNVQAGDPRQVYSIGGVAKAVTGVDDSDGDKFKIAIGAGVLGTAADVLTIDPATGYMGVGQTIPVARLEVVDTSTAVAGNAYGFRAIAYGNPAGASAAAFHGANIVFATTDGNAQNFTNYVAGGRFTARHDGDGMVASVYGGRFVATLGAASTGGVITQAISGMFESILNLGAGGAAIGTAYGIKVGDQSAGATNYAIYTGLGTVYFGDKVGVGTVAPILGKLEVQGGADVAIYGESATTFGVWGYSPDDYGVFGESETDAGVYGLSIDYIGVYGESINSFGGYFSSGSGPALVTGSGSVGIGVAVPLAKTHIDQASTTAAIPVLLLDQADLSEEFIELTTTVGAGNPVDTAALGTYYGKMRVNVTGVGYKYIALYNT